MQDKIHIPSLSGDQRVLSAGITPLLQKFSGQITTVRFQMVLMLMMALADYLFIQINGVSGKLFEYLILYSIEACFFFTNVHVIFPKLSSGLYSLTVILSAIFLSLILFTALYVAGFALFAEDPAQFLSGLSMKYIANPLYRGWQKLILSFLVWSAHIIKDSARREQILETSTLFSRISPHMLFNALNMLPTETSIPLKNEKVIELLSHYTRNAMIEIGPDGKGLLSSELDQLETLLEINKLRFGKTYIQLHIHLSPDDINEYRLPPQIIVTLAENIFKYGIVNDPTKPALITIDQSDQYLMVRMTNHKFNMQSQSHNKIGLNSVRKRLINIYGKSHNFNISETLEMFSIEMTFPI
jgi:hypothetical protein